MVALLDELAEVFADPESSRALLEAIEFPRLDIPSFSTARLFWAQIASALEHGKIQDGMARLAAAAARRYPYNEVFPVYAGINSAPPTTGKGSTFDDAHLKLGQCPIEATGVTSSSSRALHVTIGSPQGLAKQDITIINQQDNHFSPPKVSLWSRIFNRR
jgi:hypothetical protein